MRLFSAAVRHSSSSPASSRRQGRVPRRCRRVSPARASKPDMGARGFASGKRACRGASAWLTRALTPTGQATTCRWPARASQDRPSNSDRRKTSASKANLHQTVAGALDGADPGATGFGCGRLVERNVFLSRRSDRRRDGLSRESVTRHARPSQYRWGPTRLETVGHGGLQRAVVRRPAHSKVGGSLFTGSSVRFDTFPSASGECCAQGRTMGTQVRARIFASTLHPAAGTCRVGIGNDSSADASSGQIESDVSLGVRSRCKLTHCDLVRARAPFD